MPIAVHYTVGRLSAALLRKPEALRPGEALVFDWHRVAICCAVAGEVSRAVSRARQRANVSYPA